MQLMGVIWKVSEAIPSSASGNVGFKRENAWHVDRGGRMEVTTKHHSRLPTSFSTRGYTHLHT